MNKNPDITYVGDEEYLAENDVNLIVHEVVRNFWKLKENLPERFKLDINIVSDKEITKINRKYLEKNNATDVIAFAFLENAVMPVEPVPLIGQIIISKDRAKKQAAEYGHSVKDELEVLIIHGVLHVIGWREGKEIQSCQKKIKEKLQTQV